MIINTHKVCVNELNYYELNTTKNLEESRIMYLNQ